MTSGEAFEALNHAGHLKQDLIVVLNDNEMSISPNVGALSSYLNRVLTGHLPTRMRDEFVKFLRALPGVGEQAAQGRQARRGVGQGADRARACSSRSSASATSARSPATS